MPAEHSITDAAEFRPDAVVLEFVKFVLLRCVEFFGVGGSGEFACLFSGFGEPKLPM